MSLNAPASRWQVRHTRPLRRALTVGAIVPDAANPFFADVLKAPGNHLRANGHRLLAAYSGEDRGIEEDLLRLIGTRVDALMLVPTGPVGDGVRSLAARMPVVLMDRDGDAPELASVSLDNVGSARNATRTLLESGLLEQPAPDIRSPVRTAGAPHPLA